MRLFPTALLALAAAGVATPALAQSSPGSPPDAGATASTAADFDVDGDSITIGAGGVYLPDYEGSNDYRFTPAPGAIGSYDGFAFTLAGNRASVDLIPNRAGDTIDFQAGPIGVVNFNRSSIKSIDDRRVRALGELGTAIELGGFVGIGKTGVITSPYDRLSLSLSYRYDVNGVHKSGIWQPTINYFTPLSTKAAVGLFVSGEHVGDGYARSYFTVTQAQSVASGLPAYTARGGWKNYTLGAIGTYALSGDLLHGFKIVAGGTYSRLLNDFGDSPIVSVAGSRDQWLGTVGLAYTF
ncbi:MipA/OmpV family protein [Sphingomonas oligophenolica]|uniref:MipA/OmpV family protein n=1 Tax=Sphingomonas oligophenolica TaxID=301154 RepID=A0A502CJ66_9SPHN|nr:MipA/OmpV family protein [Sphingomonas oligophenolica]TPG13685.1 MipA/OmpV family protein [Sphingomonas oligophenolica]